MGKSLSKNIIKNKKLVLAHFQEKKMSFKCMNVFIFLHKFILNFYFELGISSRKATILMQKAIGLWVEMFYTRSLFTSSSLNK